MELKPIKTFKAEESHGDPNGTWDRLAYPHRHENTSHGTYDHYHPITKHKDGERVVFKDGINNV